MQILLYSLNYAPEPTGTGKYNGELAEWLVARGHSVDVITGLPHYPAWRVNPEYRLNFFRTENLNGVRVMRAWHYVPSPDRLNARNRILLETTFSVASLRYWFRLLLLKQKYDIVLAISPPMQLGLFPFIYHRLRNVPWVFHIQDLQVDAAVRLGLLNGRFARALYGVEAFFLKRATRVSSITEAMRRRIVEKGVPAEHTWLFPNWSDISFIRPLPRENSFRREVGVGRNEILAMYAGNMGEKQGLELVLHAADRLRGQERLKFILIGAGAARSRLEGLAKELHLSNVMFLPVQPLERLPEMLAAADIHLVVQRREAADLVMPSKLTNILAAGRPSVATADPGTALYQVLTEYNAGLVTPPGNVEDFVRAIKRLSDDSELRRKMGQNARAYAESYLDKEKILSGFEEKLVGLIEETRGGRAWSGSEH